MSQASVVSPIAPQARAETIRVRGLCKRLGDHDVLRGIDFSAYEHETVSIIGRSGSGKSTLLRCLNLLEVPEASEFLLKGEPIQFRTGRVLLLINQRREIGQRRARSEHRRGQRHTILSWRCGPERRARQAHGPYPQTSGSTKVGHGRFLLTANCRADYGCRADVPACQPTGDVARSDCSPRTARAFPRARLAPNGCGSPTSECHNRSAKGKLGATGAGVYLPAIEGL